jgi:hypothetical protein
MTGVPNEPPRLLEETSSPVERALLEAGTSYRTSAAVHAKTLAAVGIAGTAALADVARATISNSGWSKWLTTLSVMGATAAIPVGYYVLKDRPQAALVQQSAPRAAAPSARAVTVEAPAAAPEPTAPAPLPANPKPEVRSTGRSATLAEEVDAVDAARSALARGDARSALSVLDAYARSYPRGRLALEAEVLRIHALDKSGQVESARRRAELFLRHHPKSVLASRVRRFLNR